MTALASGSKVPSAPINNRPFILLPLYIYPTPSAWEPLYLAAAAHPELDFFVVVNPGNGPGPGVLPDANYVEALARLTGLHNVKVIGYVHCSYGNRLLDDIVADVTTYRGWTEASELEGVGKTIVVDGIFIDEVPSSTEFVQYLATLSSAAKAILNRSLPLDVAETEKDEKDDPNEVTVEVVGVNTSSPTSSSSTPPPPPSPAKAKQETGSPPGSTAIVIYNPGVVIDPIFYQAADYVVAFEDASRQWASPTVRRHFARLPRPLRQRSVAVAHSTAGGLGEVVQLGRKCSELGCSGQFITTQPGYTDWCPFWGDFVGEMARRTMI